MDKEKLLKLIGQWLPLVILVAFVIVFFSTGNFGMRDLRKENRLLRKEYNLLQVQKEELQSKLDFSQEAIESFQEIQASYRDSIVRAWHSYDDLIIAHEKQIDILLSMPTDSMYVRTREWIRTKMRN